jgi:hypothetical protein
LDGAWHLHTAQLRGATRKVVRGGGQVCAVARRRGGRTCDRAGQAGPGLLPGRLSQIRSQ